MGTKSNSKPPRLPKSERRDVGTVVYILDHALGNFEMMSLDREIHAHGATLDQTWHRYYKLAERKMRKSGKIVAAHPKIELPAGASLPAQQTSDSSKDASAFSDV